RCWVESGWKLEPAAPDTVELELHGCKLLFERRIFTWRNGEKTLVYFTGLSAGRPLAYRLDHNLSVGFKQQLDSKSSALGARARAADKKLWSRVWNNFQSRQQLIGPKQFIRLATPL